MSYTKEWYHNIGSRLRFSKFTVIYYKNWNKNTNWTLFVFSPLFIINSCALILHNFLFEWSYFFSKMLTNPKWGQNMPHLCRKWNTNYQSITCMDKKIPISTNQYTNKKNKADLTLLLQSGFLQQNFNFRYRWMWVIQVSDKSICHQMFGCSREETSKTLTKLRFWDSIIIERINRKKQA